MTQTAANTTGNKKAIAYAKCKILSFEEEKFDTDEGECKVFTAETGRTKVILLPDEAEQTSLSLSFGGVEWDLLIVK